jgi:hypothetical protein
MATMMRVIVMMMPHANSILARFSMIGQSATG